MQAPIVTAWWTRSAGAPQADNHTLAADRRRSYFFRVTLMKTNFLKMAGVALVSTLFTTLAWSQAVQVQGAWARATVPGQKASGAFMQLTAKDKAQLVSVSSPLAGEAAVHEMKMNGDVMQMRAVEGGLDLPAGQAVELKPGGFHIMLMDLKAPLKKDTLLPLTLVFRDSKGTEFKTELKVPVSASPPAGGHAGH